MQDPSAAFEVIINSNKSPQFPEQEQHLKCPRCESTNTKFCYYNNYNLSQPRHFCKNCRRYWTKGGALRNIPVGGGTRKNSKRTTATSSSSTTTPTPSSNNKPSSAASSSSTASTSLRQVPKIEPISAFYATTTDSDHQMLDINGSFSSLLASSGNFGNLLDGFHSVGPMGLLPSPDDLNRSMCSSALELQSSSNGDEIADPPPPLEDFLGLQGDSGCCIGTNGWPDLAIYTPGSTFQ